MFNSHLLALLLMNFEIIEITYFMRRHFVILALAIFLSGYACLALAAEQDRLTTRVYFKTGSSVLDTSFAQNAAALDAFAAGVNAILAEKGTILEAVLVETGASPEGGADLNDRLSIERARSVRSYLLSILPLNASQVKAYSVGADWEGLWKAVWNSGSEYRQKVLNAITAADVRENHTPEAQAKCIRELKAIDRGQAWAWLSKDIFPSLRAGAGTLRCIVSRPGDRVTDTVVIQHYYHGPDAEWYLEEASRRATMYAAASIREDLRKKPKGYRRDSLWRDPVVALRTNLLLPLLNIGVEVPIGNRWSVAADWYSPWLWRQWGNKIYTPQQYCFEGLGGYLEGRYWFGNDHLKYDSCRKYRLSGHSLGLIIAGGYYDLQWDWKGRQGEYGAIGIGYMYGLPLGKKGGVHLEFEIAFGYLTTGWRSYEVHEPGGRLIGDWQDGSWKGPVPLKAGFNLVVPIFDNKSVNSAK